MDFDDLNPIPDQVQPQESGEWNLSEVTRDVFRNYNNVRDGDVREVEVLRVAEATKRHAYMHPDGVIGHKRDNIQDKIPGYGNVFESWHDYRLAEVIDSVLHDDGNFTERIDGYGELSRIGMGMGLAYQDTYGVTSNFPHFGEYLVSLAERRNLDIPSLETEITDRRSLREFIQRNRQELIRTTEPKIRELLDDIPQIRKNRRHLGPEETRELIERAPIEILEHVEEAFENGKNPRNIVQRSAIGMMISAETFAPTYSGEEDRLDMELEENHREKNTTDNNFIEEYDV